MNAIHWRKAWTAAAVLCTWTLIVLALHAQTQLSTPSVSQPDPFTFGMMNGWGWHGSYESDKAMYITGIHDAL